MSYAQIYFQQLQAILDRIDQAPIEKTITWLHDARMNGRTIFIMGNGGSASTASHFVCDLAKNTRHASAPPFKVIGLTDNMAILSAYANDEGYENVFAQQLASLVQPGDIVIGISTSGNSPNVLRAIEMARHRQARTIGFTGFSAGQLGSMVDLQVHVPSDCIEQVEDIHLVFEHLITKALREMVS
ncbi:MAG: SIS domain-containing protein [Ardenticatenaceae bacterium]|nr:SIS domain-containing protein [Anaerolineales bacterium]MCB8923763.1 SIS domain-containing protein [Ardenticatenaceae bacterium]MCB8990098.1 SIS domain-containing protein [Ardenticatenaceae bacterium]